jgi:Esterase-like activity of phytase
VKRLLLALAAMAAALVAAVLAAPSSGRAYDDEDETYSIGLWGDVPYSDAQQTVGVPNLIADMNRRYTGRIWNYRVDAAFPNAVIGDLTALDQHRFVLIERDDDQGAQAAQKKIYTIDLRRVDADGYLVKRLVLDLLHIGDPNLISLPARPGEFGVGDPFSFPLQSVESLEILGGERLLIANDNNYPFSDGRWVARDRPDDIELIVVRVPGLR